MRSKTAKVLHPVAGRPMVTFPIERVRELGVRRTIVVVGHQAEKVKEVLSPYGVEVVHQTRPLGTAHAVIQVGEILRSVEGAILILNGDTPLIRERTLRRLIAVHESQKAVVTLLTATVARPEGYGRAIRSSTGRLLRIVEEKDAKPQEKKVHEINTGFYVVERVFLLKALKTIKAQNKQEEYYLTDIIEAATKQHKKVASLRLEKGTEEVLGINTRLDLAVAEKIVRRRILVEHLLNGVTLLSPDTTMIDSGVIIGRDTVIYPNVQVQGLCRIGEDCVIYSNTRIANSKIGSDVVIRDSCVVNDCVLENGSSIGPFAHLRPGTILRRRARVGNFVETKKTELGEGSKANHLTYLGDTVVGRRVNIGAGTITCNYDGYEKFQTVIEDEVFIGSDTQLVAPVRIGKGAVIGAGSTITKTVPGGALSISRNQQSNKPGWAAKRRALKVKRVKIRKKK